MSDVKKIHICEIMGLVNIFRKNKMRRAPLAKNHPVSANLWVDISTGHGFLWWLNTNASGLDRNVNDAGACFSKGPIPFGIQRRILKSKPVPSSKPSQFCFVNWYFHCIIFKIIETLILNANTANVKQLLGPQKLLGISRNGPQAYFRKIYMGSSKHFILFFLNNYANQSHNFTNIFLPLEV